MKALNRSNLSVLVPALILFALTLTPTAAAMNGYPAGSPVPARGATPGCPAGAESECIPRVVGAVVLCTNREEVGGYNSVSEYCLACHAGSRPMAFEHPLQVVYPQNRAEFRDLQSLDESIALEGGRLTCRTCHAGLSAANHFLIGPHTSDRICSHCHLSGVGCPDEAADTRTVCFPGRLNGGVRCITGHELTVFSGTSEFCADCHGSIDSMARTHPVEVLYPVDKPGFRRVADLDPKIRLEDGLITCETCHAKMYEGISLCVHCHPK